MSIRAGVPVILLETDAHINLLATPKRFDLFELFAEADRLFPGLGADGGVYFRISVTGTAGARIKQGDATVVADGTSYLIGGAGESVHTSALLEGGLTHVYGLLNTSTHISLYSSDNAVSVFLQIVY